MATTKRTDDVAIGIDFGTSKCCVAAVRDGRAHVLENEFGQRTTPSWVAFNSQQRLVGGAALDQAVVNCANTVSAVKRTLGRTYDDVKGLSSTCKIKKCYSTYDNFRYCVNYRQHQLQLSPEQITAMMLAKMKDIAETSLGCEVNRAVISVPTSYGNAQRAAIINSAIVAGLDVLQLINETTAAGIAFEHDRIFKMPATIAVVDFGAGKLDISVMELKEKSLRVLAASGDPCFGGCDIDEALVDHFVEVTQKRYKNIIKVDDEARVKLRLKCEKVKKTLSFNTKTKLSFGFLVGGEDLSIPVDRHAFSMLFDTDFPKTIIDNFERLFNELSMKKEAIDKVVLVGGSTRIPAVKSILEEYFGSHKLDQTVNQDEAVAQGAALRAAALSGAAAGIEVADVSSFDVGYSVGDSNEVNWVVNKYTSLPSVSSCIFKEKPGATLRFFERMHCFDGDTRDKDLCSSVFNGSLLSTDSSDNADLELRVHLDENGMFSFSIAPQDERSRIKVEPVDFHLSDVIKSWVTEEKQFRDEAEIEISRVEAEGVPESFSKYTDLSELCQKVTNLNNEDENSTQTMDAARDTVAQEKKMAVRKQAEMKLLNAQISVFESLLSEVFDGLQDPDIVGCLHPVKEEQSKKILRSLMEWKENVETTLLTQVSQKLKELTRMKHEVDLLKVRVSQEKARLKDESTKKRDEEEMFAVQMSAFKLRLSQVIKTLDDSNLEHRLNYSKIKSLKFMLFSFKLNSCRATLSNLTAWKDNVRKASPTQFFLKWEQLIQVKCELDQLKENLDREIALSHSTMSRFGHTGGSSVTNGTDKPSKHVPKISVSSFEDYGLSDLLKKSQETLTDATTTSGSIQTQVEVSENSRSSECNTSEGNERENHSQSKQLTGNLDSFLDIIKNTSRNVADCKSCMECRLVCFKHYAEAHKEFSRVVNSLPEILIKDPVTESLRVDFKKLTPHETVGDVGSTDGTQTSNFNTHDEQGASSNGCANSGGASTPLVTCETNDVTNKTNEIPNSNHSDT